MGGDGGSDHGYLTKGLINLPAWITLFPSCSWFSKRGVCCVCVSRGLVFLHQGVGTFLPVGSNWSPGRPIGCPGRQA